MTTLNREMQRDILVFLKELHPKIARQVTLIPRWDTPDFKGNLLYLMEHGLLRADEQCDLSGNVNFSNIRITARGLDFLTDDGGLTAILGIVTVRFNDETLRALIGSAIDKADAPAAEKSALLSQLRALPADVLKSVTLRAIHEGLDHVPNVVRWLHTCFQSPAGI